MASMFSATHAQRLERWLGPTEMERLIAASRGCQVPVAVANVPGTVFLKDGDFIGSLDANAFTGDTQRASPRGQEQNLLGYIAEQARFQVDVQQKIQMAGFTSLADLISEATSGGKMQTLPFTKVGVTGVANACSTLFYEGTTPAAGSVPSALAAGTSTTSATAGALQYTNPTGGDYMHLILSQCQPSVGSNVLLLYDRLWSGLIATSSSGTQTITHTLARYATSGTAPGNFAFIEQAAAITAVAHSWTLVYTDDAGNTAQSAASLASPGTSVAKRLDHAGWMWPLLAGDMGFQKLESITCSVNTVTTGSPVIVAGHPLAFVPCPLANQMVTMNHIQQAFNLVRIYDDACLALLEINKGATTATTYAGLFNVCAG